MRDIELPPDIDAYDPDAIVEYIWGAPDIEEVRENDAI